MKKGSKTTKFGTTSRVNHDSSDYYNSKLYSELSDNGNGGNGNGAKPVEDNVFPVEFENKIIQGSSENMKEIPDNSLHLMVT